jgi:hypothetical protein
VTSAKSGGDRSYKRSWKNLLLNKRYQLRFTLFMVGLTSLLMVGLGIWVMRVANETTTVSMASVRGEACPKLPSLDGASAGEDEAEPVPVPSMKLDEVPDGPTGDTPSPAAAPDLPAAPASPPGDPATAPAGAAPAGAGDMPAAEPAGSGTQAGGAAATPESQEPADRPRPPRPPRPAGSLIEEEPRRVKVQIDESSMTLTPTAPRDLADQIVAHWTCELRQTATFDRLERGRQRILWAMIGTGILLVLGLAFYGLKMTHRVAGPLFKVSLYLGKMRSGRFDKVYNLRKGDQLVDFYDHFKLAHGGVVAMQRDDIARIAAVIAAAEAAGMAGHPAIAPLREMLERKEKSIE